MKLIGKPYLLKTDSFKELGDCVNTAINNAMAEIRKKENYDTYGIDAVKVYFVNESEETVGKIEFDCILYTEKDLPLCLSVGKKTIKVIVELEK